MCIRDRNNKENEELGSRKVAFGRELYIERDDFMIDPPKKYFRMYPGNEVRLMNRSEEHTSELQSQR